MHALTRVTQRPRLTHILLGWCFLLGSFFLPGSALAQAQSAIQMTVTPFYGGNYTQGTWLPLQVALQNNGSDTRARLEANTLQSSVRFGTDVDLPAGSRKEVTLYVLPDSQSDSLDIVLSNGTTELARAAAKLRARTGERLVGLVGSQPLNLALPRRQDLTTLPLLPIDLTAAQLPDRAVGLGGLSTIVLQGVDTSALSDAQRIALVGWVADGGQLVLGGGLDGRATLAGLPPELQPAQLGTTQQSLSGTVLATYVVTSTQVSALDGVTLTPAPDSSTLIGDEQPLVVERAYGAGRVQQLAFPANSPALASWSGTPALWDRLLRPVEPATAITGPLGTRLDDTRDQLLTTSLSNLPALDLPSVGLLLALLLVYFVVIGPLTYIVLRRLRLQLWGWLLIPAIVVVFSAITFGLGFALRASDAVLNQITVIEPLTAGTARVRTLVGVYSARSTTYDVRFSGAPLLRPLRSTSGAYGPISGSAGSYLQDTAAAAQLSIPAWSLQGLMADTTQPFPAVNADITINGSGTTVRVTNPLSQTLRDVAVRYGEQVVRLGDIPAGQQAESAWLDPKTVDAQGLPPQGSTLGSLLFQQALEAGRASSNIPDRQVMLRQGVIDALLSNGTLPPVPGPTLVGWLDASPLAAGLVGNQRIAQGQTTVLLARPRIVAQGAVTLGRGWLNQDFGGKLVPTCTANGVGLPASPAPLTMTLSLPPEFAALRPTQMTLTFSSSRTWPNAGVQTSLYNWQDRRWDEQNFDGPGDLLVNQPERYLQNGRVLVQLGGRISEAECLQAYGTLQGTMP